jgi:hypothetical protein
MRRVSAFRENSSIVLPQEDEWQLLVKLEDRPVPAKTQPTTAGQQRN